MSEVKTRCGFVAIIGAPNAGKSTLINTIVGEKISIVSSKVQTTRTRVLGIVVEDNAQVVFVDTPGLFKPGNDRMEKAIVAAAWEGPSIRFCCIRCRCGKGDEPPRAHH